MRFFLGGNIPESMENAANGNSKYDLPQYGGEGDHADAEYNEIDPKKFHRYAHNLCGPCHTYEKGINAYLILFHVVSSC